MNTEPKLLTRDKFREAVFARDGHVCVFCGAPAADAHHIIERRLWPDGGYYIENGASVCEPCHMRCETTEFSVESVRERCGIRRVVVPPHLYPDQPMDKWGNPVLPNGQRLRGELFGDASVQKVLKQGNALTLFTHYVKYPRTHHVPWSDGMHEDDRVIPTLSHLEGFEVIVTEKMDGENTTMYSDHIHARSVDSQNHPSRNWVKNFWAGIRADIPDGWRVCGENVYAQHSIPYTNLATYFLGFSMWNAENVCLGWDETLEWFQLLGITPVPTLYRGIFDEKRIRSLYSHKDWEVTEGYVVRRTDSITYANFRYEIAKFVRKGHVQTTKHWMHGQPVVKNELVGRIS